MEPPDLSKIPPIVVISANMKRKVEEIQVDMDFCFDSCVNSFYTGKLTDNEELCIRRCSKMISKVREITTIAMLKSPSFLNPHSK
jgi:hypothetical protein